MPLYEYKCLACLKHTEKIQKFSDPEITTCPLCGGTLQRVITAPAIAFKGGGWYADGYGNAKPASDNQASDSKTGEAKSGEPKPDSTPSAKDTKPASSSESSASPAAPAPAAAAPAAPVASSNK